MKNKIKELRVKIDGLAQLTKKLKPIKANFTTRVNREGLSVTFEHNDLFDGKAPAINSSQIEKAVDSLYLAKAWLGKVLGELGAENPYGSGYKNVEDIKPTADTAPTEINGNPIKESWRIEGLDKEPNHIEKVDWLRQEIEKLFRPILNLQISDYNITIRYWNNCLTELEKSRFWLGFELERCKNEE